MATISKEGSFLKVVFSVQGSQIKPVGLNLTKLTAQEPGCLPSGKMKLKKEELGHKGKIRTPKAKYLLKCNRTATMSFGGGKM